ncbi:glucan endo-1,3-beta-glucosidase 1-like isoform X1 [Canna indica]|uniref:glucan endo-1,3-beta-D-glucosidase n=1 Tax=Canna indica TaxID=4628 RepID=A0AAQ3Q8F2_9LILI|nr:glucan endo-1,3-beta-glucosidase 1-like isoform X1 [Canna indica]
MGSIPFLLLTPHLLFLLLLHSLLLDGVVAAAAPFVGVNIGTDLTNLLSPADLAAFLKAQQIKHVRLYDADPGILSALSGAGVSVAVGVPNNQLLALGSSTDAAASWVARHVVPFHPYTPISAVAVGDEVPSALPSALPVLLPALQSISDALAAANLSSIPVSTPLPFSVILDPFPPSQAYFNQTLATAFLLPLLRFLNDTSAPLMLNLYPYYALMQSRGAVPLDNALFKPLPPALEEVDPNTLLHYTNVLDAMVDAAYVSMRNLNFTGVPVLISETGWPHDGSRREEPYATRDFASTYNSNLIRHIFDRAGTPMRPESTPAVYIYELFNEDLRPGPVSEANWGLFYGNGTPVYLLHVTGAGGFLANDTTNKTYCVAAEDADRRSLQAALDWACGPGRANCSEIQPGESCYDPNDVRSHASYAFDSYYQMEGKAAGSCYFQGIAMITTTDPSHGDCIFPGSKEMNITKEGNDTTQASRAGMPPMARLGKGREQEYIISVIFNVLLMLSVSTWNFWT